MKSGAISIPDSLFNFTDPRLYFYYSHVNMEVLGAVLISGFVT
jgi:hypothetical protein